MNCLIDSVGLIGCGTSSPASNLFINALPGISLRAIDKISDEEQKDYQGVWNDVQTMAAQQFSIDVAYEFGKRFKLNRIASSINIGKDIDTATVTTASAQYRGVVIDTNAHATGDYKPSALQSHYVQSISFYSTAIVATATFKVVDAEHNSVLDTFTSALVVGWNLIQVNKNYGQRKIAVGVNAAAISTVYQQVDNNLQWTSSCDASIEGFTWTLGSETSGTKTDECYGLSIIYGTRCSYDNVVCNNKDEFYLAWMYLLAIHLTIQRQFSTQINRWTLQQKEAEGMKLYFESEYQKVLNQIVYSINLDEGDCCLECDSTYTVQETNVTG
tara:strand:+ start:6584 stop:7570 length:987 start_codon:yes stop_codon:yes gene_type:complete